MSDTLETSMDQFRRGRRRKYGRACVRPDHLVLGTQQANLADMRTKGRGNASGLKNSAGISLEARYAFSK